VSAAAKRSPEPTPTPFPSRERAQLAAAIVAATAADTRKAALAKAVAKADAEVYAARRAVKTAEVAIEVAQGAAAKYAVDAAMGVAGAAPMTVREARARADASADDLEAAIAARDALKLEAASGGNGLPALLVQDAARQVIRSEMQQRAVALADRVAALQRELVAAGSGLEWLHRAGVLPKVERGVDDPIRHTVERLDVAPSQWAHGPIRTAEAFAVPAGRLAWQSAYELLLRDATTQLPVD
jgi:hypothetical protein